MTPLNNFVNVKPKWAQKPTLKKEIQQNDDTRKVLSNIPTLDCFLQGSKNTRPRGRNNQLLTRWQTESFAGIQTRDSFMTSKGEISPSQEN